MSDEMSTISIIFLALFATMIVLALIHASFIS